MKPVNWFAIELMGQLKYMEDRLSYNTKANNLAIKISSLNQGLSRNFASIKQI